MTDPQTIRHVLSQVLYHQHSQEDVALELGCTRQDISAIIAEHSQRHGRKGAQTRRAQAQIRQIMEDIFGDGSTV